MNWIERMYEIKGKDLYSQNGEGLLLEYVLRNIGVPYLKQCLDIGGGDGFYLSNTFHLTKEGFLQRVLDAENGQLVTTENLLKYINQYHFDLISIDIDGNDYWILDKLILERMPLVICAEFNPAFTDSRTIKYNPSHEWAGDDYYGFSFEAGKKLAEKHGYTIIFIVANMNLIMVRNDLIQGLRVPDLAYWQSDFFKKSNRPDSDWVWI